MTWEKARATQLATAIYGADMVEEPVLSHSRHPGASKDREKSRISPLESGAVPRVYSRYCDQPTDWRSRLFGFSGTATVTAMVFAGGLLTWKTVSPSVWTVSQPLTVIDLAPIATTPEPVREVPPGPDQVERQEAKPEPTRDVPPVPIVQIPANASIRTDLQKPVEIVDPGPPVPETTAPKSIAAPAANRLASNAKPDWEALILAHLERFRRYPSRARAARQQGVAYVRFTMNRAGMVTSAAIAQKSGSFDLDRSALDTLERAQPLPAIPGDRPDVVEMTIPVVFNLR